MTTQTKPLSVEEVRALLVRAIEEKGADYVYPRGEGSPDAPTCNYFRDGEPSCIVGHVLHYLGFTPELIDEGVGTAFDVLDNRAEVREVLGGPNGAVGRALQKAQSAQDNGKTWGEALAAFDEAVTAAS